MLNNRIKQYPLYTATKNENTLKEKIVTYTYNQEIDIAISFNTRSLYQSNDINVTNCQYIGVTNTDAVISKGDKIGDYLVEFIQTNNRGTKYIYLSEVANSGRI